MRTCTLAARATAVFLLAVVGLSAPVRAQGVPEAQTVEVGEFDFGKMWTFENAPAEYFSERYGFDASPEWFERARMAALRIPGCSASFVSPNGLVVTNHHCARGSIASVSGPGENLLDNGFYAETLGDERPIPGTYADQLEAALDVTEELEAAENRESGEAAITARLKAEYGQDRLVQFVGLYNGARTSAYVIRRFTDIRLVAAVELSLGFFGGDPDNFTYPRYALDYTFYRVYDEDGEPFETEHWFEWGDGAEEGEPIFLVGNPGPTNRLLSVAELEYQRDYLVPGRKAFFESRLQALRDAYDADPVVGEELGLRNQAFSLSNALKAYTGRLEALQDSEIMARKQAAEDLLMADVAGDSALTARAESTMEALAELNGARREIGDADNAFYLVGNQRFGSIALLRALRAVQAMGGGDPSSAEAVMAALDAAASLGDHPGDLEEDLLALRIGDIARYVGEDHPAVASALDGRSPEGAAAVLLQSSILGSTASIEAAQAAGGEGVDLASDPIVAMARALLPSLVSHSQANGQLAEAVGEQNAELGRIRFQVYGTRIAPDASSSPRITDGVVQGYEYNGTEAPSHTTMYGIYDRYYSHAGTSREWILPERWVPIPEGLDLGTPLNFVSTADSYGGNSGSPALTRDLEIVGLNFDRNIEGLSRDFIYLPARGRNIMVDTRAIRHTLDVVYDADRIVLEIDTGRLVETEAEADAARAGN